MPFLVRSAEPNDGAHGILGRNVVPIMIFIHFLKKKHECLLKRVCPLKNKVYRNKK